MLVAWVLAQAAVATAPAAAPTTLQAQFEQATASLIAKQWDAASTGFHAIEARPGASPRTRSIAGMREGDALFHLNRPEAADTLRKALALAPAGDPSLDDDRAEALLTLGGIERGDFDFVAARREFEAALALSQTPASQITTLMALADVTMFDEGDAALGYIDQALKVAATNKVDATVDGRLHDLRGRVLMNRGDLAGAVVDLKIALKDNGGLTSKTDLDDVAVRSDLTLAYLLSNEKDKARDILGMTGEGRLPDNAMLKAPADLDLPTCGGDIRPDDVAVVEFGLSAEGTVLYATPIYASRRGAVALVFARALDGGSWTAEQLKDVPAFYRLVARLELRCSTAMDRPSPLGLLRSDVDSWLASRNVAPKPDGKDARAIGALKAILSAKPESADNVATVPALMAVAQSSETNYADTRSLYARAGRVAAADHAPAAVQTYFGVRGAMPMSGKRKDMDVYNVALANMLATSAAGDARSAATVRLMLAQSLRTRNQAAATAYLDAIVADRRLSPRDPLRVGALLQLAALKAEQHDLPGAQKLYEQTGLDDQQCALVDASPVWLRGRASEQDYPEEARLWGISGWARTEFDIKADGTPENLRTVMAYPPFVFGPPIEGAVKRMKYTQTYRPQGGLGCGGQSYQQGFHYVTGG